MRSEFEQRADELIETGRRLHAMAMVPAASGSLSFRLSDESIAVAVDDSHKGHLERENIMLADMDGNSLDENTPPDDLPLHIQIYRQLDGINCVLHPHSVNATILSLQSSTDLKLQDYELLNTFSTPENKTHALRVPLLQDSPNIENLVKQLDEDFAADTPMHGYLIKGHGLYTWGKNVRDALRHVEAFEFMFKCVMRMRSADMN